MTTADSSGSTKTQLSRKDILALSGMDFVRGLAEGTVPRPTMVGTMPFTLLPQDVGKVELLATPENRFLNLMRTVHGGWSMTMLDTAMALAAQTTLAPGEMCPTHETTAKFVRPIPADVGEVRISGLVISRGRTVITLEGRIACAEGKIYAHGTSTCMIIRMDA